jgi:mono/diheme cytochrome c family protein
MNRVLVAGVVLLLGVAQAPAPLTPAQIASLPAPADRAIDFVRDIKPILQNSCVKCHGRGRSKGGFSLETRDALLEGGDGGPAIVPGASQGSHLIALVAGLDPDLVMPQKGSRLKPEQIGLLRAWIDQGARWDPSVNFARIAPRNIDPREPTLPPAAPAAAGTAANPANTANPIDRLLAPYFAEHGIAITPAALVNDLQFARRVWLDAIGLLPTPAELQAFVADRQPDKRTRLVARLLGDRRRYAEHWLSFWNDVLRNDYRGTGFIDGGRQQISNWLYTSLFDNLSYDRFVAQLINPAPGAEGFTKGIVWRGVVNASQTPPMQAAQNVSQVFMGVNLKCASCHDSFINDWQLADAYGLAGIYADAPLEMVECDRPTGHTAPAKFLYAKLGTIDAKAARPARLEQLAQVITARTNGRLSRTIVNRLWARFMGRGLVEPVDDMDQPAWNADLLDWLAEDLVAHGYDLKHTMAQILTSRAYQMVAVDAESSAEVFRGPLVRRMSAEQFADAMSTITGVWQGLPAGDIDFTTAVDPATLPALQAHWIWRDEMGSDDSVPTFRKTFPLPAVPFSARALVAYDGPFVITVNGKKVSDVRGTAGPSSIDIRAALRAGENEITITANKRPPPAPPPAPAPADAAPPAAPPKPPEWSPGPGLFVDLLVRPGPNADTPLTPMASSDRTWQWQPTASANAATASGAGATANGAPGAKADASSGDRSWQAVGDRGGLAAASASTRKALTRALAAASVEGHARAALVAADPLTLALGRPNREQVVTTRTTAATTLQALELSNGGTLARALDQGAARLLADKPTPAVLITRLYQRALGRNPTAAEAKTCRELLGPTLRPEGVQDVLWVVVMLPEFQLIY